MKFRAPTLATFQEVKIPKGRHAARPYWLSYGKRDALKMQFVFTDYARYNLPGVDQQDWNKLAGLSFNLFTNHRNSAMVSWRYNPDSDLFELGFYCHVAGKREIRKNAEGGEVWATVGVAGVCRVVIAVDHLVGEVKLSIVKEKDIIQDVVKMKTNRRSRVINTWFGGNNAAPNDIYILRKLIN